MNDLLDPKSQNKNRNAFFPKGSEYEDKKVSCLLVRAAEYNVVACDGDLAQQGQRVVRQQVQVGVP